MKEPQLTLLKGIATKAAKYGERLQPAASENQLNELAQRAKAELKFDVPADYMEFLRVHNGIDWNGFSIYATEIAPIEGYMDRFLRGFVETNLQYWEVVENRPFITFGESGDSRYVFDLTSGTYQAVDSVSLDLIEEYADLGAMLAGLLSRASE